MNDDTALCIGEAGVMCGFRYLWLKCVHGFNPRQHCLAALRGPREPRVHPAMLLGQTIRIAPAPYVYLCGVALGRRYDQNLHIAMRHAPGVSFDVLTWNGIRVRVENAEQVAIHALPAGFRGLGPEYTTCRNYQFGVAYLEGPMLR